MIFNSNTAGAVRWWKNGDHPSDNSTLVEVATGDGTVIQQFTEGDYIGHYSPPEGMADLLHTDCGSAWRNHGYIESGGGRVVCPGNWIVKRTNGRWDVVALNAAQYEDQTRLGDPYTRAWYCVEDAEQHLVEGDGDSALREAAAHATDNNHLVHLYGVLPE